MIFSYDMRQTISGSTINTPRHCCYYCFRYRYCCWNHTRYCPNQNFLRNRNCRCSSRNRRSRSASWNHHHLWSCQRRNYHCHAGYE